jgi:general secretion pathway protein J
MAYNGLDVVLKSERLAAQRAERMQALQSTMLLLSQDMAQLAGRRVRDEYGDHAAPIKSADFGNILLEFTRGGRANPLDKPRSSLQRVAYGISDDTLVRTVWGVLDRTPGAQSYQMPLLEKVRSFKSRFLNHDGEWLEEWPPLGSGGFVSETMPKAVEITLELEDWGEIRRVFRTVQL